MPNVFLYVVDRDFGFAPNPFHGYCTLATCKPRIRTAALIGDWVVGMGGRTLASTGHCIFAMEVSKKVTFDEYWSDRLYYEKKPVRNGSKKMLVGDNIYHRATQTSPWQQANSHHSSPDGSANQYNVARDTGSNNVLIATRFFYFGKKAPKVPPHILESMGYKNVRDHRKINYDKAKPLIDWLFENHRLSLNQLAGDPFDFSRAAMRYSAFDNKVR